MPKGQRAMSQWPHVSVLKGKGYSDLLYGGKKVCRNCTGWGGKQPECCNSSYLWTRAAQSQWVSARLCATDGFVKEAEKRKPLVHSPLPKSLWSPSKKEQNESKWALASDDRNHYNIIHRKNGQNDNDHFYPELNSNKDSFHCDSGIKLYKHQYYLNLPSLLRGDKEPPSCSSWPSLSVCKVSEDVTVEILRK